MRSDILVLAALAAVWARAAPQAAGQGNEAGPANNVDGATVEAEYDFDEEYYYHDDYGMPRSTSNGFVLVSNATGPGCDGTSALINEVTGLYLQGYHTGAGAAAAILHDVDLTHDGHIFYLNGTKGGNMSILTDGGQPQVPYGLVMPSQDSTRSAFGDEDAGGFHSPFPDPFHDGVALRVGPGTPAMMGSPEEGVLNLQGMGTFMACNRTLPYNPRSQAFTVNYLYTDGDQVPSRCSSGVTPPGAPPGIPENCVPIALIALCAHLPPATVGGYSTHAYTHPVDCYSLEGEEDLDWLYEGEDDEEAGAEWAGVETGEETEPEVPELEVEVEHGEEQATEQAEQAEEAGQTEETEETEETGETEQIEETEQPESTEQPEQPDHTGEPEQPEQTSDKPEL